MFRSAPPVTVSATIGAPADDVYALIVDTRNDPAWCPNVDSVEQLRGDGPSVGASFRYTQHLRVPGRGTIAFDGVVTVVEMGARAIRWRVEDRFQHREIGLSVEPIGPASCRVSQTTAARFTRPNLPGVLAYPFLARRELRRQFAMLAALLE